MIGDERVRGVLSRLHVEADRQTPALVLHYLGKLPRLLLGKPIPFHESDFRGYYADKYIALEPQQGAFCYLTARALGATSVVEFGTSFGVSTIWLAAAVRDNGGGRVVGTELVPEKAARAAEHLEEAGLSAYAEIRIGDARETLADLDMPVDLFLNDGLPDLALDVVRLVAPRIRTGGVVITDNVGTFRGNYADYVHYMHDPSNGFSSTTLPFKSGTLYSVRV